MIVFEQTTGWRLHSEYDPMPDLTRKFLDEFFVPHNHMLERLLSLHNATVVGNVMEEW